MSLRAVIIDDELPSIEAIENIIAEFCPKVKIEGKTQSPKEGIKLIIDTNPDVVFLDIEMPLMNGFELLDAFPNRNFHVVFITAYDEYAIKAFKVNAIDYLLKPINITDVINATKRIEERLMERSIQTENYKKLLQDLRGQQIRKINISGADGVVCLNIDDIIRIGADGRYSRVYLVDGTNMCFAKTLKDIEKLVDSTIFLRVHKSHLLNMSKVKKYNLTSSYQVEMEDGAVIDISRRKKDEFLQFMIRD